MGIQADDAAGQGGEGVLILRPQRHIHHQFFHSAAAAPFHRPEVRDYIENVRRNHEQIIDNVNLDTVSTMTK